MATASDSIEVVKYALAAAQQIVKADDSI